MVIISSKIEEDIPYLELITVFKGPNLNINETIICRHVFRYDSKVKKNKIALYIIIHMDMMKTCCSEIDFKLNSLPKCNFLNTKIKKQE